MNSKPSSAARNFWGISLSLFLFLGPGCAGLGFTPNQGPAYKESLTRFTRVVKLYRGLDTQLDLRAVYRSRDFRREYVQEYARVYNLSPAEREKLASEEEEQAEKFLDFILVMNTTLSEINDLHEKNSVWSLSLLRGPDQLSKPEVKKLQWKDCFVNHFYPYANPWSRIYLVRFSLPADESGPVVSGKITLEIAGPPGKAVLEWP